MGQRRTITFDMSDIFCNVLTQKVPMFLCVDIYYPFLLSIYYLGYILTYFIIYGLGQSRFEKIAHILWQKKLKLPKWYIF